MFQDGLATLRFLYLDFKGRTWLCRQVIVMNLCALGPKALYPWVARHSSYAVNLNGNSLLFELRRRMERLSALPYVRVEFAFHVRTHTKTLQWVFDRR